MVAILAVRGAFVVPLLMLQQRRAARGLALRDRIAGMTEHLDAKLEKVAADGRSEIVLSARPVNDPDTGEGGPITRRARHRLAGSGGPTAVPVERASRWRETLRRRAADIDYITGEPLGWREGVLLVWAGMRGVVTLAAAQSVPAGTPHRAVMILVAFTVAAGTLLVQGATLPWVVRRLGLAGASNRGESDRIALRDELDAAAAGIVDDPDLARPDGTAYHPDVVTRVRADVIRRTEARPRTRSPRPTGSGSTGSFD